jgi:hypothetical protein
MNDTPTPSPFATDGQRTTDAECWMNYCLEAEKGLATVTEQRDAVTLRLGNTQERMIDAERQRDRLAEALLALRNNESFSLGGAAYEIIEQALQPLTPKEV